MYKKCLIGMFLSTHIVRHLLANLEAAVSRSLCGPAMQVIEPDKEEIFLPRSHFYHQGIHSRFSAPLTYLFPHLLKSAQLATCNPNNS